MNEASVSLSTLTLLLTAATVTMVANALVTHIGRNNDDNIWDVGFRYLPYVQYHDAASVAIALLPLVLHAPRLSGLPLDAMLKTYGIVLLMRVLTMTATVLPKTDPTCDPTDWGLWKICTGQCYDSMFSGHTALTVTIVAGLVASGAISATEAWTYGVLTGLYMVLTRAHFTMDVLVGAMMAWLVFWRVYTG